jgi:acyl carrier protein phosphodiesterase
MSQQVISYADLSVINGALRSISSDISSVNSELGTLNFKQDQLEGELVKLADAFADFVEADLKHKSLQLAETRQGNLKQDLQIKFGYYAEVRRMATGIVQAVDTGIVSDETLRFTTEEVMIKAPGYWLAPTLVALAAWVRSDKNTNEKALNEALKRDDYKTTLFFMLVMRRLTRNDASLKWLERYFMHQNPHNLDREFIIILEAVTTGVFPPAARHLMMINVKNWLDQLTLGDTFINQQKSQWIKFFEALGPLPDGKYPLLEKFSTNWNSLENSLKESKTHDVLNSHFKGIISSSSDFSKGVKVQLDEILSLLVTNFDDEELPLQEQVRLNQLIIQMDGDKAAAQAVMDAEKHIFDEQVDFLQLLTNASFNPELSGATKVTQALAVSISQPWIVEAHDTFTAQSRNQIPQTVDLVIDDFNAYTKDGSDENELLNQQVAFYQNVLNTEFSKLSFPYAGVIIGALVCILGFWAFSIHIIAGIVGLGIGGVLIWTAINTHNKAKKKIEENIEERESKAKEVLRGCIAETVDYRIELFTEDNKAERVRQLLTSITPEDFSSVSKETARNII